MNPDGNLDLLFYSAGDRKVTPFLNTKFNEESPEFSPDGRWLTYASDESGRFEVYVQPYALKSQSGEVTALDVADPYVPFPAEGGEGNLPPIRRKPRSIIHAFREAQRLSGSLEICPHESSLFCREGFGVANDLF